MIIYPGKLRASVTVFVLFFLLSGMAAAGPADERRSTLEDQLAVAVTIYNEDLALVKDVRKVQLDKGMNRLAMREVSARIRPETAQLRSLSDPGAFTLFEQNFDFDLLTPAKLLEKYLGRAVHIVKTHPTTGRESTVKARVLSTNNGVVLKVGDRIETGVPGRLVFDSVPANLRDRPTLVMQLQNKKSAHQELELSYLTGGLAWQADYVAELNGDDSSVDLNGWVTLTNQSGTTYPNARLQLVAGDVNRVREDMHLIEKRAGFAAEAMDAAAPMSQQALFEYHLYTLARPTTIADKQTKQVALLSAADVPVRKELVLAGNDYYYRSSVGELGQKMKIGVYVEFENKANAHLGMPLPKGVVRVYKKDQDGNAQFVGEDRIEHTPKNEKVRLRLGNAFDVTADKKQTGFKKRASSKKYHYAFESAYEIVLKNAKPEAVTVSVQEPVPGDWKMLEESHRHTKATANTALWRVKVPAEGSTTLRYRVLVRY